MDQSMPHFDRTYPDIGSLEVDGTQTNAADNPSNATKADSGPNLSHDAQGPVTRIAWIDAYALSRDCIMKVLSESEPKLTVHPFASVTQFLASEVGEVDAIVLHAHGSYETCLQETAMLRAAIVRTPVVILSDLEEHCQIDTIRNTLRAGASGFISTRSMGLGMTLSAIRFVQSGGTFAPLDLLLSSPAPAERQSDDAPYKLTARQRDVLAQLQQGKANKIIAHELGMSESTAKVHIRNIMRKMGATNRTQAAFNALKHYPGGEARSSL